LEGYAINGSYRRRTQNQFEIFYVIEFEKTLFTFLKAWKSGGKRLVNDFIEGLKESEPSFFPTN